MNKTQNNIGNFVELLKSQDPLSYDQQEKLTLSSKREKANLES